LLNDSEDSNDNWQYRSFEEPIPFIADQPTFILPVIRIAEGAKESQDTTAGHVEEQIAFIADQPTFILPVIRTETAKETKDAQDTTAGHVEGEIAALRNLIKSSGIYALSSVAPPLVSLVVAPFLTHNLSPSQYGILTIINTAVGLCAGITQFGLSSAFFRAYGYDYTAKDDK